MTEDEITQYERDVLNAKTDEDIKKVAVKWNPVLIKCFRSTSLRVKELNKKMDELKGDFLKATTEISTRITELHRKPTFKESKVEWMLANIEKILLSLIVLSLIFGRQWVADLLTN